MISLVDWPVVLDHPIRAPDPDPLDQALVPVMARM